MWSARHRRAIILAWVFIVVLGLGTCTAVPAKTDIEVEAPGEAGKAFDLFQERFGVKEAEAQEFVVFSHPSLTVDDPEYEETVKGLMAHLRALRVQGTEVVGGTRVVSSTRIVAGTTSHYDIGTPREQSPFVAQNETGGDVTFALVGLEGGLEDAVSNIDPVLDAVAEAQETSDGFEILVGGDASLTKQVSEVVEEDFARASFLEYPIMILILILAFGALVAALVPVALAFAAIVTASGILAVVSQSFALSEIYTHMVLLMGLATGIDYSLFVITRFRRERAVGVSKEEAIRTASGTSGKAVVFAGATVVLAIGGMFLVDNAIFVSLALAAIVVVALAVVISMTLLPALIAMLGDNIDRLSIPFLGRGTGEGGGVWGFITDRVLARPAIMATVTVVLLLALAGPVFTFNLGFNGVKSYSDDVESKKAVLALEDNFTIGLLQPAWVVVDAGEKENVFAADVQASAAELVRLVKEESVTPDSPGNPYGVLAEQPDFSDAGDTEVIFIPINADTGEDKAIDAVDHLRDDLIPAAFEDSSAEALVTGATASNIDFRDMIYSRTPFVVAFVLGLAFIILLLMFRSIVIPVKAIILNLLSVGAAYGVLVLVFQKGWLLEGVLGFEATGIIESWLPLFLFAILFGLSMDYHMFVLSRIKESYEKGMSNEESVSAGIKATAATITSAAAIMVAVFTIFAFTRNIGLKQFGVGLGVAVLIDATVIRSILLPASMKLLGEWNWYLPSWLEWIPRIKMAE
jgi:RND superfamily putative drug exporter